jgi:hypothetical protein
MQTESRTVTLFARKFHERLMRFSRKAVVVLVLATYLFAGALHGLCDIDLTNPSGSVVVSMSDKAAGTGDGDKGLVAEHHCHGCFSVSVPSPMTTASVVEMVNEVVFHHDVEPRGVTHGIDLPPPKLLT